MALIYAEFLDLVSETFLSFFPETWKNSEISIQMMHRNSLTLDGLTIQKSETDEVVPTLYVQDMYQYYLKNLPGLPDKTLSSFASAYMKAYRQIKNEGMTEEKIMDSILSAPVIPCLIAQEGNEDFLSDIVWTPFLDMAIIYQLCLAEKEKRCSFIIVRNDLLPLLHMTKEELHEKAMNETFMGGPEVIDMADMIYQSIPEWFRPDRSEFMENWSVPLKKFVTNKHQMFGAAEMLNTELLKQISDELGNDLYLLPSSVHEFIIAIADESTSPDTLREMVEETNGRPDVLKPEEVLTNNVYRYSRERNVVEIA